MVNFWLKNSQRLTVIKLYLDVTNTISGQCTSEDIIKHILLHSISIFPTRSLYTHTQI